MQVLYIERICHRSPDNIVEDYVDIQRNAFDEQVRTHKAL